MAYLGQSYFGGHWFGAHYFGGTSAPAPIGAVRDLTVQGVDLDIVFLPPNPPQPFIAAIDPRFVGPHDGTRRLTLHGAEES